MYGYWDVILTIGVNFTERRGSALKVKFDVHTLHAANKTDMQIVICLR